MIALAVMSVALFAFAPYPFDVWIAGAGILVCSVAFVIDLEARRGDGDP